MFTHTLRAISKRTLRAICISLQQSGDPCAQSAAACGDNLKDSLKFLGGILGGRSRGSSKPGSSYGILHRMAKAFARVRQISSEVCCSGFFPVIRPPYPQSLEQVFLNLGTPDVRKNSTGRSPSFLCPVFAVPPTTALYS